MKNKLNTVNKENGILSFEMVKYTCFVQLNLILENTKIIYLTLSPFPSKTD